MDILSRIVAYKTEFVADCRRRIPQASLIADLETPPLRRPFEKHLTSPDKRGVNIIAEFKRASPSKGDIHAQADAAHLAMAYNRGGAAAMSVLTDEAFFKGHLEDLRRARQVAQLGVLRKDFIIDPYQLYESRWAGADAVLLIVRILSAQQLQEFIEIAVSLRLDTLVEVFDESDLETATQAGARLIGINNRNLKTFEVDLDNAVRLKKQFQPHQTAVALSGIHGPQDIRLNLDQGIFNFLIGESLMRADSPKNKLKSYLRAATTEET